MASAADMTAKQNSTATAQLHHVLADNSTAAAAAVAAAQDTSSSVVSELMKYTVELLTNNTDGANLPAPSSSSQVDTFGAETWPQNATSAPQKTGGNGSDSGWVVHLVIGIASGVVVVLVLAVILTLWCRYKRTRCATDKSLPNLQDNCWDDISLHYIDNPTDHMRESNDDISSIDNDSFLNSLDQLMFQQWTPTSSRPNSSGGPIPSHRVSAPPQARRAAPLSEPVTPTRRATVASAPQQSKVSYTPSLTNAA